jgi:hypothetical protein
MRDKVYVTIPEGKPFGMLSLIDKRPRANTARAKEDCELALLDERTFRVMVEETPAPRRAAAIAPRELATPCGSREPSRRQAYGPDASSRSPPVGGAAPGGAGGELAATRSPGSRSKASNPCGSDVKRMDPRCLVLAFAGAD